MTDTTPQMPARPSYLDRDAVVYVGSLEARIAWLQGRASTGQPLPYSGLVEALLGGSTAPVQGPPLAPRPTCFIYRETERYMSQLERVMYFLEGSAGVAPAERMEAPEPEPKTAEQVKAEGEAALATMAVLAIGGLLKVAGKALDARKERKAEEPGVPKGRDEESGAWTDFQPAADATDA